MTPVRLATPADAPEVTALLVAFRDFLERDSPPAANVERSVSRLLGDPACDYLLAGDPPVGVCQLRYRWGVWLDGEDCWLEDLYVRDEARGAGVGRALTEAALARARERGCVRVELDVNEANTAAVRLYESLGFSSGTADFSGRNLLMRLRL